MSTSLCGPSNALSSLHKHTSVDRSLQRDRFRSRGTASVQDLRSASTLGGARLEHEFASFAGQPLVDVANKFGPLEAGLLFESAARTEARALDGWASDFQNLHIGLSQSPFPETAALVAPSHSAYLRAGSATQWRPEFEMAQNNGAMLDRNPDHSYTIPQSAPMTFNQFMTPQPDFGAVQQRQQQLEFQFDDSAFEDAFEKAAQELSTPLEVVTDVVPATALSREEHTQEENINLDKDGDADELARTAGQLLDSVKENSSTKFQNSTFLALMRRLRDHEVVVEGDTMVEQRDQDTAS